MTNAELIAKIKAEIERRITDNTFGAKLELIDILAWLDTLESEKPIISGDNLESAIDSFWNTASGYQPKFVTLEVKKDGFEKIARYFAEWGAEHLKKKED